MMPNFWQCTVIFFVKVSQISKGGYIIVNIWTGKQKFQISFHFSGFFNNIATFLDLRDLLSELKTSNE